MEKQLYSSMREYLDTIPIIETHEHYTSNSEQFRDAFPLLLGYIKSDIRIAAGSRGGDIPAYLADPDIPFKKRWDVFEKLYEKCRFTAYAKAMERGLYCCWGINEISYHSICALNDRLKERNNQFYRQMMKEKNIKAQVADIFETRFFNIINGTDIDYTEISKFAFPLPVFHKIYSYADIDYVQKLTGQFLPSLEDYVSAVEDLIEKAFSWGAPCIKDQSAYFRPIDYTNPTFYDAEKVYNRLISFPTESIGFQEGRLLDDWLFQRFMRKAGKLNMPVQLHTGLQDRVGMYEDRVGSNIKDVNAALLIPTMEHHRDVRFDLFHTNWPYMDEMLYIGKNTPNTYIDMCWTHSIDPDYAVEFMKRAVKTLPITSVFGFGGDAFVMENGIGYLEIAKDNIAKAFAGLIEEGWINKNEAERIALAWLFDNPKEFFGIRFPTE